jgi:putative peptidoglycan lipid II flippase
VLADRYVIEDLLTRDGEAESWRAHDKILARSVVLQVVPSSSELAARLLDSAKRASRVSDTRILQVLDAVDDGELAYVVREWASGQSLNVVLNEGPLAARRAAWLIREVAGAMVNAHRHGIAHRRLSPEAVVVTKSSGVKLIGLGTAAALRGDGDAVTSGSDGSDSGASGDSGDSDAPELDDVQDLGRLLYACLTARWPGGKAAGLPVAPTEHGRLLRPRQVRAGVPRSLDAICDRILAHDSRYGPPITTVGEVKDALIQILAEEGLAATSAGVDLSASSTPHSPQRVEPPPALLYREGEGPPTGEQPVAFNGEQRRSLGRTLGWTALLVLIAGAVLLAYLIGQNGSNPASTGPSATSPGSGGTSGSASGSDASPIAIVEAHDFDPEQTGGGAPEENPDEVSNAFDGDPSTAWTTLTYSADSHFGNLKSGVGLILDLGDVHTVTDVDITLDGSPTDLELRAAPEDATSYPTGSADDYTVVKAIRGAGSDADFDLASSPVTSRYLLVWITNLPPIDAAHWRAAISEIKVAGD